MITTVSQCSLYIKYNLPMIQVLKSYSMLAHHSAIVFIIVVVEPDKAHQYSTSRLAYMPVLCVYLPDRLAPG